MEEFELLKIMQGNNNKDKKKYFFELLKKGSNKIKIVIIFITPLNLVISYKKNSPVDCCKFLLKKLPVKIPDS